MLLNVLLPIYYILHSFVQFETLISDKYKITYGKYVIVKIPIELHSECEMTAHNRCYEIHCNTFFFGTFLSTKMIRNHKSNFTSKWRGKDLFLICDRFDRVFLAHNFLGAGDTDHRQTCRTTAWGYSWWGPGCRMTPRKFVTRLCFYWTLYLKTPTQFCITSRVRFNTCISFNWQPIAKVILCFHTCVKSKWICAFTFLLRLPDN